MSFQLSNVSSALERATEAIEEATRNLEECLRQLGAAKSDTQEPSAEETDVQSAIATVRNIRSHIQARQETIAQQLKCIQLDFMIAAEHHWK